MRFVRAIRLLERQEVNRRLATPTATRSSAAAAVSISAISSRICSTISSVTLAMPSRIRTSSKIARKRKTSCSSSRLSLATR